MNDFPIIRDAWDLRRRSRRDILRHNERVREAMKSNLPEIISREDIITSDGQKTVKVPVRDVELPHFRFDPHRSRHVGQGAGGTKPGTVLGGSGQGTGKEAGHEPGSDYYELDITVDELVELAFEELALPDLKEKGKEQLASPSLRYDTIRRIGPQANLDARRTLIEAFKRSARLGVPGWQIDPTQDSRYRSWEELLEPRRNAVVFAMRDVSGSMGEFEAYLTRTFYTWMVRFLRQRYAGVEIVFIACHTEAREVDEATFFHLAGSGGTRMASAYALALEIIGARFAPSSWNIYPFLFSDGYNWDDEACVNLVGKLLEVSNLVGYGELSNYGHWSGPVRGEDADAWAPLGKLYAKSFAFDDRFVMVRIGAGEYVWQALRQFMTQRHRELTR